MSKENERLQNYTIPIQAYQTSEKSKYKSISAKSLEDQKWSLFWAWASKDMHYVYEFDKEDLTKRSLFLGRSSNLALEMCLCYAASNVLFFKFFKKSKYDTSVKVAVLVGINTLPIPYYAYRSFKMYYQINDYLYNKYLKN